MKESIVAVATSLFLFSCAGAQQEVDTTTTKPAVVKSETARPANAADTGITHVYAGPNLMGVTMKNAEALRLTPEQTTNLSEWRSEHSPIVGKKLEAITTLEEEMKSLSVGKSSSDEIMAKAQQVSTLRLEIATIKAGCQGNLRENLDPTQWTELVRIYRAEAPFQERSGAEALAHVSPLPNYMDFIREGRLALTATQEASFRAWSGENQVKVAALVKEVIALEKSVYEDALEALPLEGILSTMKAAEEARAQILLTKTLGRDNAIEQLDDAQWETLASLVEI